MSIIGIVANKRQNEQIKKQIENENLKLEIICINAKSIENIKNIKFESIVIQTPLEKLQDKQENIKEILKNTKYLLLNTDINLNENLFKDIDVKILTYGLKQKATITVSSIGEKQIIVSIQRAFKNLKGKIIEQQEIPVEISKNTTKDLYNLLIKTCIINIFDTRNR